MKFGNLGTNLMKSIEISSVQAKSFTASSIIKQTNDYLCKIYFRHTYVLNICNYIPKGKQEKKTRSLIPNL